MKQFVVRIEAYEGEGSSIKLTSDNNDSLGEMYCVGQVADDGVVDLIDNGYPSLGELYKAWPELHDSCKNITEQQRREYLNDPDQAFSFKCAHCARLIDVTNTHLSGSSFVCGGCCACK
jgi:hypothetical protein